MKAYIQTDKSGDFYNVNAFIAYDGFTTLGWETVKYSSIDEITDVDPEHFQNQMKLVEVNDGHSLGTCGISGVNYAKFLSARWAQLTKTKNYADF